MSRIAAVTRMPSALSSGLSMISIGNSLPSLRSAIELDPGADLLRQRVRGGSQVVGDQPLGEALGDDVRDLLAEQLVAAVAELLLGLHVQQHDLAGLVHHHHGVRRRFEQAAVAALHLRQVLLRPLLRTLMSRIAAVTRMPVGALERAQHDLDRELAAVLAERDELDAGADLLGQRVGRGPQVVGDQPLGEALGDDVRDPLTEEVVAADSRTASRPARSATRSRRPGSRRSSRRGPPPAGRGSGPPSARGTSPPPCAR